MDGRVLRLVALFCVGAGSCGAVLAWWAIAPLEMVLRPLIGVLEWHVLLVGVPSLMAIAGVRPDSRIVRPAVVLCWTLGAVAGNTIGLLRVDWPLGVTPFVQQTEEWIITSPGALLAVMVVYWDADRTFRRAKARGPTNRFLTVCMFGAQSVASFVITALIQIACLLVVQRILYPS